MTVQYMYSSCEYDTDSILPFKNRIIDWWRRADDNYEAIEIFEIKEDKWIDNKSL